MGTETNPMNPQISKVEQQARHDFEHEENSDHAQIYFHSFRRRPHLWIVVLRFLHDPVDAGVVVVGIVVKQDQFLGAALHDYIDRFAPVAVSPTPLASLVFLG